MQLVTKAVIPVAGFGTRFLPATKAQPKEMLPLVDKPIIQYIVEEAVASGIEEIIFVTNQNKRAIEDHFDRNFELEYRLKQGHKNDLLKSISHIFKMAQFVYVRQPTPRGLADAILQAEKLVADNPFAIFLGDDIIDSPVPAMKQLMHVYNRYHAPVVGVTPVPKGDVSRYGIIKATRLNATTYKVASIIEKPSIKKAPSNLAITGRYIMTPDIFRYASHLRAGKNEEINFTEALAARAKTQPLYACKYQGNYYDCGNKLGYLKATVTFGLKHAETGKDFKKFLKQTIS